MDAVATNAVKIPKAGKRGLLASGAKKRNGQSQGIDLAIVCVAGGVSNRDGCP